MNGRRLPFRTALLMLVLGSLVCTVGAIGAAAYFSASNAAQDLKERHYKLVSEATSLEVRRLLEPVPRILFEYRTLARRGMLPIEDPMALGKLLAERLRTRTFLGWISYSDRATGRFVGAWRREDGAIVINRSRPDINHGRASEWILDEQGVLTPLERELPGGYDPRSRPWFRNAVESSDLVWSEPYVFQEGQPGITASLSFRKPGSNEPAGVFTADFFLTDISGFLHNLADGKRSIVAVLTPDGDVIGRASSLEGDGDRLFQAMRAATPLTPNELRMKQASRFGFERDGITYDGVATSFTMGGGLKYIVTVVGLEDEFLGVAKRNARAVLIVGLGATFLSAVFAVVLAHRIAHPLLMLSEDLREVGKFNLQHLPPPPSQIDEINIVWESVERMKAGLRSFRCYVPEALVRELLHRGKDAAVGGQRRPLSILFSDIDGFTSISERLAPEQVFSGLSNYLEVTTSVVEGENGTLDKFMGDGAMALFNAPNDLPQHAIHACRAALSLLQRIEQAAAFSEDKEMPVIRIRIGVHTGEALVGNIGSNERFSYTALGDSVNLCARLEMLNKSYGTRILVSETTYRAAKDHFEFRHIDRVIVTGRTGPNNVYELLAKKGELNSFAVRARDAYEEGLHAFLNEDFGAATVSFHSAHELQPQDAATAVMLARVSQAGVAMKRQQLEKTEGVYSSARNS